MAIEKKADGKRCGRLALLKQNDFFGEMAVMEKQPRFAGARALADSDLFDLDREKMMGFIKNCPEDGTGLFLEIIRVSLKRLKRTSDEFIAVQGLTEVLAERKRK